MKIKRTIINNKNRVLFLISFPFYLNMSFPINLFPSLLLPVYTCR